MPFFLKPEVGNEMYLTIMINDWYSGGMRLQPSWNTLLIPILAKQIASRAIKDLSRSRADRFADSFSV